MLFASTSLAARIESAECALLTVSAEAVTRLEPDIDVVVVPLAGGVALHAGPDSPLNKVAGLGFAGPVDAAKLDRVEAMIRARGTAVQVELSTLADPSIGAMLTGRGYTLAGFENVLGLTLDRDSHETRSPDSPGIDVDTVPVDDIDTWLDAVVTGFATPDDAGVQSHESYGRDALEGVIRPMSQADGMVRYMARRDGAPAGGASMRIGPEIAHLCGAATHPTHRRRGVQRALLHRRLQDAAAAGCDIAVVTTMPGSTSQKNVQAVGFQLLYTRAILVLPVDGGV